MELIAAQALQKAIEAHKAGRLQEAEVLYKGILQTQPKQPDANHNLGVIAISLNQSDLALPFFKTALEAKLNQEQFWISYISALIKANQLDIAKSVLGQGRKLGLGGGKVDALEAQLKLSSAVQDSESILQKQTPPFTEQRKKVSAKKEKKKSTSSNRQNPNQVLNPFQMEVNVLVEHYQKSQYVQAENVAKKLTQRYPNHQFSWKVLGAIFKQTGRLQESLIVNQKAVELVQNDAEAHSNLGTALQELGRLEDAEASYKKAIAIKPDLAEAHYNLGITLKELGRLEDAEASYKKAISIKPDLAEAHNNLGITLQELGRLEDAEASYKKAISIKPAYAEAHSNLGITLKELGRLEDAEDSYKKAIAIKPDYAEAHYNFGNMLTELGRLEHAEESYRKAIAIKPDYAEAYINLGNTLKELGRLDDAEKSYKKVVTLKPDFAGGLYNLGISLYETGRYDQAGELLKLIDFEHSQEYLLRCLYAQNNKIKFYELLDYLISRGEANSIIGSLSCRAEIRYGIAKLNSFCNDPFKYVLKTDLSEKYDFLNIFIKPITKILNQDKSQDKVQQLLSNGRQTFGNIFALEREFTEKIKKIIYFEIERYRVYFKDSEEGLIKKWPIQYSLNGWIVSMKSGGKLRPHMHERGWISGSVYINVPSKSRTDSGNLVVCIDDEDYLVDGKTTHENIIDVTTGSLCLFPASLLHYTIPFESEEDRIVLAFDVIPKS